MLQVGFSIVTGVILGFCVNFGESVECDRYYFMITLSLAIILLNLMPSIGGMT